MHLKQMLEEESIEMNLCEECANERGITDPDGFSLASLLGDAEDQVKTPELKDLPECSQCGFSFQDLKKVGRFGCSDCYKVFGDEIMEMLSTMHRGVEHKGRVPEGMFEMLKKQENIEQAENELQQAIEAEDYERAGALRDKIKELQAAE